MDKVRYLAVTGEDPSNGTSCLEIRCVTRLFGSFSVSFFTVRNSPLHNKAELGSQTNIIKGTDTQVDSEWFQEDRFSASKVMTSLSSASLGAD